MPNIFQMADKFNDKIIGIVKPDEPTALPLQRREAIAAHLCEEAQELVQADTIEDQIDALLDSMYIAAGRFREMGVDPIPHLKEVQRANMERVRGDNNRRPGSFGFDAVKPEGWREPDHQRALKLATRRPKVLILGHARHGKDTVAEMLRDKYGYAFQSSSHFCAEKVMMPYFEGKYSSMAECYEDRINHRAEWFDQIVAYNNPDPARLAREILENSDLYVGMRSAREYEAAKHLFDIVVWVNGSRRHPPEDRSSFDIDFDSSMRVVANNGTLEDLEQVVGRLHLVIQSKKGKADA
jgi:hypothetical protein